MSKEKNYKYPYIPDKFLYAAVMIAKKSLTHGVFFKRAVEWAANRTNTDPDDVEYYLSIFLNCEEESEEPDNSDLTSTLISIKELINQSLSCIYWSEGDGMTNHYLDSIEENLDEINALLDLCFDELEGDE